MKPHTGKKYILPVIVLAQFFCTSLWFAGNAVLGDLTEQLNLELSFVTHLTSAVQFGFISGTFLFAILTIADRFSPSKVFFICSVFGTLANLGMLLPEITSTALISVRFMTGFFLAGIYPIGMKIAADHSDKGLGKSLGFLVGALVLGTAFPHLLRSLTVDLPWKFVIITSSCLSLLGGLLINFIVPDGPYRKPGQRINLTAFALAFQKKDFRSAAFGYFGHMWELYTFWAYVPLILTLHSVRYQQLNTPLLSFFVIASGGVGCMLSGILSSFLGAKKIAATTLSLSGLCCLISPFFVLIESGLVLSIFLIFWGLMVAADSPMFSTLVATNAVAEAKGTSLTIVNCIGFAITIVSIQFIHLAAKYVSEKYIFTLLAIGPVLGLVALLNNRRTNYKSDRKRQNNI